MAKVKQRRLCRSLNASIQSGVWKEVESIDWRRAIPNFLPKWLPGQTFSLSPGPARSAVLIPQPEAPRASIDEARFHVSSVEELR
ncbi:hypothetical protein OH764_33885 (plasmid) [Burkholderia sp. M6-3]